MTLEQRITLFVQAVGADVKAIKSALLNKPDYIPVASFSVAKTQITVGTAKSFLIANNELFNAPTQSTYDGTNWYHSPAILQNN